jgi:hypothetical protein
MVATLLERFNVIAGGDKMAQQLAPEIGTVPAGGMVSVDVEGRRLAVANVDGALFAFDVPILFALQVRFDKIQQA